jgi:hypothetical protein
MIAKHCPESPIHQQNDLMPTHVFEDDPYFKRKGLFMNEQSQSSIVGRKPM